MSRIEEFNRVCEGAKQQRAERVGSGLQTHALSVAIVAVLSFAILQHTFEPTAPTGESEIAQIG